MKTILIVLLSFSLTSGLAQSQCKPFVPVSKGSTWEITNYNPKGKEEGKAVYKLLEKVDTDSGTVYKIKTTTFDKKGNETYDGAYEAYCVDGRFKIDMAFKMNSTGMQTNENMDLDINSSSLEFPSMDAQAGEKLKDGNLVVNASVNSMSVMNMTVSITDRKVEKKEEKTTPAGTFNCLVLYQKISTKMMMKVEAYSREWYAETVGMVRSESYNKNNKLNGYSELTKLDLK